MVLVSIVFTIKNDDPDDISHIFKQETVITWNKHIDYVKPPENTVFWSRETIKPWSSQELCL